MEYTIHKHVLKIYDELKLFITSTKTIYTVCTIKTKNEK